MIRVTCLVFFGVGEELKIVAYILNRMPSKFVSNTPFKLWTRTKPSLNHFRIWGCPTEIGLFNPANKKTDPKFVRGFFIRYLERSKGYKFYSLVAGNKAVESITARFLE